MIYFLFFEILVTVASSEEKTHKKVRLKIVEESFDKVLKLKLFKHINQRQHLIINNSQ